MTNPSVDGRQKYRDRLGVRSGSHAGAWRIRRCDLLRLGARVPTSRRSSYRLVLVRGGSAVASAVRDRSARAGSHGAGQIMMDVQDLTEGTDVRPVDRGALIHHDREVTRDVIPVERLEDDFQSD